MPSLARLRSLRDAKFLSQQELADKAGVTKQTIYRLENGASAPYPRTIRKIAEALGVEPGELVGPTSDDVLPPDRDTTTDARDGR